MRQRRARRVVGVAEVNDVEPVVGRLGDETIRLRARQVHDVAPLSVLAPRPGASAHDIALGINGIDRVGDTHAVIPPQDFADVARIALRAVADEDFRGRQFDAQRREIVLQNRVNQEAVALLRSVTPERLLAGHLVERPMHRLDAGRREGTADVAPPDAQQFLLRVRNPERVDFLFNVREKVVLLQFQEVFIY